MRKPFLLYQCVSSYKHAQVYLIIGSHALEQRLENPKKIKKYAVTKSAYLLDTFPAYCGGPCTLLPSEYIKTGFEIAKNTYPGSFHHDDVLFTGVIRIKSGASDPVNINGICTHYNSEDKLENIRKGKISQGRFQVLYLKVTDSMLVFV